MELESRSNRIARWVAAFAFVVLVQGAAIAWMFNPAPIDDLESHAGGAFILELSDVSSSPDEDQANIAIGKTSQEIAPVAASAPQVASAAMQQQSEAPPLPMQPDAPPEDSLAKPQVEPATEQVQEPMATPAEAKAAPAVARVAASEAAAPQKIDNAAEKSETPKGQNSGLSRLDRATIVNWHRDLVAHMNRHKRYPEKAREARQNGIVSIAFAVDRGGRLVRAAVVKSSGVETLDQAAVDMLQRASPLPPPPDTVPGESIEFVVPVRFRWKS
jgi:protein TonB